MNKRNFLLILLMAITIVSVSTSCKKDRSGSIPKERVLTKVSRNGTLELEFKYDAMKQLVEIIQFNLSTGKPEQSVKFVYDKQGMLVNKTNHNAAGEATSKIDYERDDEGRLTSSERTTLTGSSAGNTRQYTYIYDAQGRLLRENRLIANSNKADMHTDFDYFPDGNVAQISEYKVDPALSNAQLQTITELIGNNGQVPESISRYLGDPIIYLYASFFIATDIFFISYDDSNAIDGEAVEQIRDREYDEQGFVTKQTIKRVFITSSDPDEVREMEYEYAEI